MGNQQQDYCSVLLTPTKLPDDTCCDTRRLHVYGLLPSSVARILRWQHAALYGNFKQETMETTSTVHRLLDGPWLLSRFTSNWNLAQLLAPTAVTAANSVWLHVSLTLSVYYFLSYITYFIIVMDTADVEDSNNTASVSSSTSFNVNTAHWV